MSFPWRTHPPPASPHCWEAVVVGLAGGGCRAPHLGVLEGAPLVGHTYLAQGSTVISKAVPPGRGPPIALPVGLTPAITPNVGNSGAEFMLVGGLRSR